ncbi:MULTISPECIES: SDR family NAD(P)-dependent oxidoreductase [Streptomyces]|uniref:SDR family NAD(P)-dependent oxidoreductase n=1 Tax=Streptomyces TaxID=1883 RepID=UPI003723E939
MPSLDGAVVPVTGANGGIGTHFVHDALGRGAAKVYATAHWSEEVRLHVRPDVRLGDVQQARVRRGGAHVFLARAFAPILAATQGSILIDVHSVASWYAFGGAYSASKAALWSATNSLRIELAPMGVHVMGVHMGYVDTDMAAHADGPKMLPTHLVTTVYDAVGAGECEVLADELTQGVKAALSGPVEALYPYLRGTNA